MQTTEQQIEEIEVTIEQCKEAVENKNRLHRLLDNSDFKALIMDNYCKENAARIVALREDMTQMSEAAQEINNRQLTGIGQLQSFFRYVEAVGLQAESTIAAGYEEIAAIEEEMEEHEG